MPRRHTRAWPGQSAGATPNVVPIPSPSHHSLARETSEHVECTFDPVPGTAGELIDASLTREAKL